MGARKRRPTSRVLGGREAVAIAANLGRELRATRKRRRLTQRELGVAAGVSQVRLSELERGLGADAPISTWIALGLAIHRPLAAAFSREIDQLDPVDAGHLSGQELLLGLARRAGRRASFELPTRQSGASLSVDVLVRDDRLRVLIIQEVWNRLDDLGAAARATDRKVAEARDLAVLAGGDGEPYRVAFCWGFVDHVANRNIVRRFPEALRARFGGSSSAWVRATGDGGPPPADPGLVGVDRTRGELRP